MSFGFGKNSGPVTPPSGETPFGHFSRPPSPPPFNSPFPDPLTAPRFPSPRPFKAVARSASFIDNASVATGPPHPSVAPSRPFSLRWDRQSSTDGGFSDPSQKRSSPYASHDLVTSISSKVSHSQDLERSRPPPVQYTEDFLKDPNSDAMDGHRPALRTQTWGVPVKPVNCSTNLLKERNTSPMRAVDPWKPKDLFSEDEIKRGSNVFQDASIRPSLSPKLLSRSSLSPHKPRSGISEVEAPDLQFSQRVSPSSDGNNSDTRVTMHLSNSVSKRTRSPPAAAGQIIQMNSPYSENDAEREQQAKAKRLARFRTELDEVEPSIQHVRNGAQKKVSLTKTDGFVMESKKFSGDHPSGSMEDMSLDFENEHLQSSSIIVGMCPDMCPESERGERERKGDLDRYERLDGDRNQTSKTLAVKKYNRTAEREAELIRPMPILKKTMDYLLGLLDQPYDDKFLGLYNFLWDRMRAIRMDLRMQHIFNHMSITMLEQMIRLHVIAMHELCEFSRGEGFSEGFDAHLNIEQMNKTSVELFQIYDDHRKKGIFIPTEKEFRGYYALLKLDKHPGYKVEPAELSLDLAKMTAEIRQTQAVLFARDVARSCRTGNFIAFFRHARKASYLQACLMHAHFSKLRTQALASLHSGLQYNQGLPVTHVAKWLGMEGEDIESLLEYHGFVIKEFEEPYMVKDGPFLNDNKDYPTRCSKLVHRKQSNTIVEDVLSSPQVMIQSGSRMEPLSEKDVKIKHAAGHPVRTESPLNVYGDAAMNIEAVSSSSSSMQVQPVLETSNGMQFWQVPESRIGQPVKMDVQRVSAGSPRNNSNVPKAFSSLGNHSTQEQSSPVTPKDGLLKAADGQFGHKSSPWEFSAEQRVPAHQTPSLSLGKQDDFKGLIQNSPDIIARPESNAAQPAIVSANVIELIPPEPEVASSDATTSLRDNVFMEEECGETITELQQELENDDAAINYDEEVAEAKLRLLLRLWRRRSTRKKEFREQSRLAANAALSSLSLGPPIWQNQNKHTPCWKLNIDRAVHERYEMWKQSRVRWNVADLVVGKLAEYNANSNCVCWKVASFSWLHHGNRNIEATSSVTHPSLDEWLCYKLIPASNDGTVEGLAISAPGLSVWRKWAHNHSGEISCYFSVIKDTQYGNSEEQLAGTSALLFPISNIVPWDLQRAQLHNLVMSLPTGACVPLLILCGSDEDTFEDFSSSVADKLGLKDLDKSRVGRFLLICLNEREDPDQFQFHGHFSDQKLKEGLMWLASESRSQPVLSCVTMRELVSLHLNSCLDALDLMGSEKVGPNQCILAFNEALDQSINDIVTAAKANSTHWPCPELLLLDDSTAEFRAVKKFLPCFGWSSSEEIAPLVSALRNCKLPYFPDELSWLGRGCSTEKDIEDQRQLLQDCLIRYLTQLGNEMYWMMAAKEASLMVQSCARLELHDTEYKMVPSWLLICRRVFNWQLNSSAIFTCKAYVLEQSHSSFNSFLEKSKLEVPTPRNIVSPSLDEMVEISCSPIVSKRVRSSPKSFQNVSAITSADITAVLTPSSHLGEDKNQYAQIQVPSVDDSYMHLVKSDLHLVPKDKKETDRLVKLLDQCNMLQDEIEKKLSIYF